MNLRIFFVFYFIFLKTLTTCTPRERAIHVFCFGLLVNENGKKKGGELFFL